MFLGMFYEHAIQILNFGTEVECNMFFTYVVYVAKFLEV